MKADLQQLSFEGATEWLNRKADTRQIKGHPTLVHFWSTSSETSKINLSQVAALRDHRKREGLRVVAVHVPLAESEKNARTVRDAIARLNLTEACALDNEYALSEAFLDDSLEQDFPRQGAKAQGPSRLSALAGKGFSIPAYCLFDIDGELRRAATGTNALDTIEDDLDQLFLELRANNPFCPACELFLNKEAMFCSECGSPLTLPGSVDHPYYENNYYSSLPTIRLANPDPLIGHVIDGKYELLARLGEGGMSVVYRAKRVHIGDDVAVKILTGKYVKDDAALARFKREARAAAMLRHPNVITIHDFGETEDEHAPAFIVMEFVKGTPLRELLHGENRFSVERGVRLMRGICAGVGAAHRQGVVHRDLKPENILVVAAEDDFEVESVRVVDFGLAKLLADAGAATTGAVVGTPFYMSPEQCLGEPLDARSDVYSLGAMFYEMLSGTRPFAAETVSGVINRHLSEPPPPFAASLGIPRRVSIGIMHALAKEPDDRPQNATELARQMQLV